jgi:hypothetical protein
LTNGFVTSMITTALNVCSMPLSFWAIEKLSRHALLIYGAIGMLICEFLIGIIGTVTEGSKAASTCLIVFTCIYVFFFATTLGPGAWVLIGEIFPLPIRAKGVALPTSSDWFWNFIISFITPYLMNKEYAYFKTRVFFIWGSTCTACVLFAYFFVPETKGLSLEQVDRMLEGTTPRTSSKWVPHSRFAEHIADETSVETPVRGFHEHGNA